MLQNSVLHTFLDSDYSGRIINENYSYYLQNYLTNRIRNFLEFEHFGSTVIPYISAWEEGSSHIWFEYSGKRLTDILECSTRNAASCLRASIIDRCVYKSPELKPTAQEILAGTLWVLLSGWPNRSRLLPAQDYSEKSRVP